MKVTKRGGRIVFYDDEKLVRSILLANDGTGEALTEKAAQYMADVVLGRLVKEHDIVTTQLIREGVIELLRERGFLLTAARYKDYCKAE